MSEELLYNPEELSEINVSTEKEFIDLKFSISNYTQAEDSTHIITGHGKLEGKVVGVGISVRPAMFSGLKPNGEVDQSLFYNEGINFYRIGPESDEFIKSLSELFGFEYPEKEMADKIESLTFVLASNSNSIKVSELKCKVFFDIENEKEAYSEWFVNVNIPKMEFELREKDPEYRKGLIKNLTK